MLFGEVGKADGTGIHLVQQSISVFSLPRMEYTCQDNRKIKGAGAMILFD